MDIIKTYLENMFLGLPQSGEVLRAKEELLTMMEDKYHELKSDGRKENEAVGIVISEFGNLSEVAEELGLSAALKEEEGKSGNRIISQETARDYIGNRVKGSRKISFGVLLLIWAPILLILLSGTEGRLFLGVPDGGIALGLGVLLLVVAVAVGIFIYSGVGLSRYDLDQKGDFVLDAQAESYVRSEKERTRLNITLMIITGVMLCIMSVLPLVILGLLDAKESVLLRGVALLLFLVGTAVFLFILAGMKQGAYDILLKTGDYSETARYRARKSEDIGSIYWPIILVIYLIWSFTTGNWGYTWIVWPIAGVLFAAVVGIMGYFYKKEVS